MFMTNSVCDSIPRLGRGWGIQFSPAHITQAPLGAGDAADPEANKARVLFLAKELVAVFEKNAIKLFKCFAYSWLSFQRFKTLKIIQVKWKFKC